MTAIEQVHAELEQRLVRRQRLDAMLRPPKDPREKMQTDEARSIRAHNAKREAAFHAELQRVRELAARMDAGGLVIVAQVAHGWRAWCEDCGAMSPVCGSAGGAAIYRHDCYSQTPPAADATHF
ncbi:hypothetical protein [Allobranchiibius huperziae]|uniref:Uncharacterized protein n=1 Tax=Allobranchiibius huperziae TaxID=1874116 RepID=A0A853DIJ6_9MICO|nr:hypothetical protein [Allobranchiibius huperziae]NYJ76517.1 hypothetical protein [Allobranchiibius huperziae]